MHTVEDAIRFVFPYGLNVDKTLIESKKGEADFLKWWGYFPSFPTDLFAISAYLVKNTGAYTLVKSGLPDNPVFDPLSPVGISKSTDVFGFHNGGEYDLNGLTLTGHVFRFGLFHPESSKDELENTKKAIQADKFLDDDLRKELTKLTLFKAKKERSFHQEKIQILWQALTTKFSGKPIFDPFRAWESVREPEFFKIILRLMIIADEACVGIGQLDERAEIPWMQGVIRAINSNLRDEKTGSELVEMDKTRLNVFADVRVASVLPKAKTNAIGCSIRSMSQNVTLAPPVTVVDAQYTNFLNYKKSGPFNLLLIPFPFKISENAFYPFYDEAHLSAQTRKSSWRWFGVQHDWVQTVPDNMPQKAIEISDKRSKLVSAILRTISEANKSGEIHGIIMPELALDFALFNDLAVKISQLHKNIELFISGTVDAECPVTDVGKLTKVGNFACTAVFSHSDGLPSSYAITAQHKHHRWKLTREQIENLNCAHKLDPSYDWWENINISTRNLYFWGFREKSILGTIICEDLARIDPAQQVIRDVGPSLLVALLMDGPQMKERWPGTYADTLSKDPGCSVLTLTSAGLMRDRADGGRFTDSNMVALWSDNTSREVREISMHNDAIGIILNLRGFVKQTSTLDGRCQKENAKSWELNNVKNVFLSGGTSNFH